MIYFIVGEVKSRKDGVSRIDTIGLMVEAPIPETVEEGATLYDKAHRRIKAQVEVDGSKVEWISIENISRM